ncbi:alpha-galactosidase [Blastomonas sp.]|uniref:alpha-galactosidase n=1 Tax=Blastomonas sp. TaxID=1909299 RepID=UPI003592ECBB
MSEGPSFARLDGERTSAIWMQRNDALECLYLGPRLAEDEDLHALAQASARAGHENQPDVQPTGGLLPDLRTGWRGPLLVGLSESGKTVHPRWAGLTLQEHCEADRIEASWHDQSLGLALSISWSMRAGDIIAAKTNIWNTGERELMLTRCASLLLALPHGVDHVTHFAGRWADDMRAERLAITRAGLGWVSRGGKSGFAGGDWLVFDDARTGACLGFHLAWTGDHEVRIARDEDGQITLLAQVPPDALGFPAFMSPEALFACAKDADALTHAFHVHARACLAQSTSAKVNPERIRKVHFNTWEACGFDFDEARLMRLAEDAANLGVERFVLDDGWFKGRSSDRAGLGDLIADPQRLPRGLGPLTDHVQSLGMDFGLWVEPEMVSPDSDLYRAHPDWCFHEPGQQRPTERGQLVLDLGKREVADHLFECIARLLRDHDIAYLKWDHNRRLFPPGAGLEQVHVLHAIWARLRDQFPDTMIESCASGGGRIDMSLIGLCERVWPSDNNDPIERVRIMREWSRFLPLEALGNHVGPSPNPITGRSTDMDFRAKVALFGHMGVEADPGVMETAERMLLAAHIMLYKQWRQVLHSGAFYRLDHPDPGIFAQLVTDGAKVLALVAQTTFSIDFEAAPVRLKGLDADAPYRVTLPEPWPRKARHRIANPEIWRTGITLSGAALMHHGLALPLTHPETAWLIALERLPQ